MAADARSTIEARLAKLREFADEDILDLVETDEMYALLDVAKAADRSRLFQSAALTICRDNGFVFNDLGREPGNWQHLAFTFYTMLCEIESDARAALDRLAEAGK